MDGILRFFFAKESVKLTVLSKLFVHGFTTITSFLGDFTRSNEILRDFARFCEILRYFAIFCRILPE